eukprot:scaffold8628_cov111-Isochrysis_galbana.AAC.3
MKGAARRCDNPKRDALEIPWLIPARGLGKATARLRSPLSRASLRRCGRPHAPGRARPRACAGHGEEGTVDDLMSCRPFPMAKRSDTILPPPVTSG